MPSNHKEHPTISFRPSEWARKIIEQRAELSGMYKKDFITRSCVYSNIVVVGKNENIQRIVDEAQEMQAVMIELLEQIYSGRFKLSDESYNQLKEDYMAFTITLVDILDGAAYLFEKEAVKNRKNWKAELELEQYRNILKL
ncbi:MAG: hypothetical protein PUG48_01425 [Clostridia bacterium]|nr:hypothetical protein [Clostridia bacterium]